MLLPLMPANGAAYLQYGHVLIIIISISERQSQHGFHVIMNELLKQPQHCCKLIK
jgi:hypothetical protein